MAHTWTDGEKITKELLNDLEQRADRVGEKGEKGDTGAQGPKGDKGEKGDTGAGLTGSATQIAKITEPSSANAQAIAEKLNEVIDKGVARGLWTLSE